MQVTLSKIWDEYVVAQVGTGLYADADDVVRAALRLHQSQMESRQLRSLQEAVAVGARQAEQGEFVEQSLEEIFAEAETEYSGQL